jgi:non-ribosomal peptide synthetase component F
VAGVTGPLHADLVSQAQRRGDDIALVMGDERVSYGQLDADSSRLSSLLAQAGVRAGDRVAVISTKSPSAIAAMLAVLKVGAAYVPFDAAGPEVRARRILDRAQPRALLVAGSALELLAQLDSAGALRGIAVGALDDAIAAARPVAFGPRDLAGQTAQAPAVAVGPDDPAHILFTSGSTGEPKGVVITHANITAFLDWAVPHFGIAPGDRLSGHPPLHFDLSTFDVYGTLRAGAELHLVGPGLILPGELARFIADAELTQWFSVPSAMTYLARAGVLPEGGFASLRRILWCGEVLPVPVLAAWMRRHPRATFTNLYGPTETTIARAGTRSRGSRPRTRRRSRSGRPARARSCSCSTASGVGSRPLGRWGSWPSPAPA